MKNCLLALIVLLLASCASTTPDLIIANGRVIDGSGSPARRADVAIRGGRIVAVGELSAMPAALRLDAKNHIVAPGFIDVHAHIELGLFQRPTADNFVQDGVTTVITGNCGGSADSLKEFLGEVDTNHTSINVASLVGHNTVRRLTMGLANRAATPDEQRKMEALVDAAMRDGAVGLSTGLIYLPGLYSNTDEVVGLARIAARHRGLYASHIRNESNQVADAINEALDVGRRGGLPVQVSHFKVSAPGNWGRSKETLAIIDAARAEGMDVTIDQYPYTASSTNLFVMLPDWAVEGGTDAIKALLADPVQHAKIVDEMEANARRQKRVDFSYAVVARHPADARLNGKNIAVINREKGRPAGMREEIETMLELMRAGGAQMVYHGMHEDDVRTIMRYPHNMVGADGGVQDGRGMPHPRSYGTNARILGKYVREEKIITLEEAVRRMTSLAAGKFKLDGRGLLREGYAADIVVFDADTVADRATFENPHQFSAGFDYVLVNGRVVVDNGRHTGEKSGVALRGPGYAAR